MRDDIALQQVQVAYLALESIPSAVLFGMDKATRESIHLARSNISLAIDRLQNPRSVASLPVPHSDR